MNYKNILLILFMLFIVISLPLIVYKNTDKQQKVSIENYQNISNKEKSESLDDNLKKTENVGDKPTSYDKNISETYNSFDAFKETAKENEDGPVKIPYQEEKNGVTYSGTLFFTDGDVNQNTNQFVAHYKGTLSPMT